MSHGIVNTKHTILLVDDLPENLKVLGNIILNNKYEILLASSGAKAIEIAHTEMPDLILLDIQMPELDGYEVCRRLKSDEKTREIPIIFITARSETEDMVKGFEAGGVDYVTKPFQAKELLARIKTHLELKDAKVKLVEMAAAKDKFLTIIAHDLKNPFNSLLGLTDYMISEFESLEKDRILENLKVMERTSNRAYILLQNLLQWAKANTGKIDFHPEEFNLTEVINESVEITKSQAINKSIHILNNAVGNIPVLADKQMISTVLTNFITNAIKFTPRNGVIKINKESNINSTIIAVSDTGVGIPEDKINTIFNIDTKHSSVGTDMESGTGLGLLICKEFIEYHRGKIWVESNQNQGSIFRFSIPQV